MNNARKKLMNNARKKLMNNEANLANAMYGNNITRFKKNREPKTPRTNTINPKNEFPRLPQTGLRNITPVIQAKPNSLERVPKKQNNPNKGQIQVTPEELLKIARSKLKKIPDKKQSNPTTQKRQLSELELELLKRRRISEPDYEEGMGGYYKKKTKKIKYKNKKKTVSISSNH
jgi:hypothetical protein